MEGNLQMGRKDLPKEKLDFSLTQLHGRGAFLHIMVTSLPSQQLFIITPQ